METSQQRPITVEQDACASCHELPPLAIGQTTPVLFLNAKTTVVCEKSDLQLVLLACVGLGLYLGHKGYGCYLDPSYWWDKLTEACPSDLVKTSASISIE